MLNALKYLSEQVSIPVGWVIALAVVYLIMQIIGEIIEFKTKAAPEWMSLRKKAARKKKEREALLKAAEIVDNCDSLLAEMKEVKTLFKEVKSHYSPESLKRRNDWMHDVDVFKEESTKDRASIHEMWETLSSVIEKVRMQLVMVRADQMRTSIINFARLASDEKIPLTREEYNRIFKLYASYEALLEENGMENGEIDTNYSIITKSYEHRMISHSFIEDMR